jgi:hypothetical protein
MSKGAAHARPPSGLPSRADKLARLVTFATPFVSKTLPRQSHQAVHSNQRIKFHGQFGVEKVGWF